MKEISVKKTVFYAQGAMGSGTFAPLCKLSNRGTARCYSGVTGGQARCYSRKIEILAINIEGYTYF